MTEEYHRSMVFSIHRFIMRLQFFYLFHRKTSLKTYYIIYYTFYYTLFYSLCGCKTIFLLSSLMDTDGA